MDLDVVAIRLIKENTLRDILPKVTSTDAAASIFFELIGDLDREVMALVTLDNGKQPINASIVSMGTLNHSLVHPREIFKTAILSNASSIIIAHNHPGGSIEPSDNDKLITERLIEAGNLLGIDVIDHIIIGADNYYSFFEDNFSSITSLDKYEKVESIKEPEVKMMQKRLNDILENKKQQQVIQKKKPVLRKNTEYSYSR